MSITYPIQYKIAFPAEYWPDTLLVEREEKVLQKRSRVPYTFAEIAVLMLLCAETNSLGICRMDMKRLLELFGLPATKANVEKYTQVVLNLLQRNEPSDYVRFITVMPFEPACDKGRFEVRPELHWRSSQTRFFTFTNIEFAQIVQCARKHRHNVVTTVAVYLALKSTFYSVEVDNQSLMGCIISKNLIAKRCGLSLRAIDPYLTALQAERLISWKTGRISGAANAYCLGGHEKVLDTLMGQQIGYFASQGYYPLGKHLHIKKHIEGIC